MWIVKIIWSFDWNTCLIYQHVLYELDKLNYLYFNVIAT